MSQEVESLSDRELLGTLLGRRTAADLLKQAGGSLFKLMYETGVAMEPRPNAIAMLMVARELVRRSLLEGAKQRDVLSSPASVRDYLRMTLAGREHEAFIVLFLDAQNRVLRSEEMFRGTLTQTSVYPREIVKRSLAHNAAGVLFAHNHPSGVAEPSRADETLTRALRQALSLVDVKVLDHFVVAGNGLVSFAESGLL